MSEKKKNIRAYRRERRLLLLMMLLSSVTIAALTVCCFSAYTSQPQEENGPMFASAATFCSAKTKDRLLLRRSCGLQMEVAEAKTADENDLAVRVPLIGREVRNTDRVVVSSDLDRYTVALSPEEATTVPLTEPETSPETTVPLTEPETSEPVSATELETTAAATEPPTETTETTDLMTTSAETEQPTAEDETEALEEALPETTGSVSASDHTVVSNEKGTVELDANGVPVNYARILTGVATAYSIGSVTSTGTAPAYGTVAVDPKIIPYGSLLYIVSDDGSYTYGPARAEDTGGFIYWDNAPIADLYFYSESECIRFGRRNVTVYVLDR